MVSILIEFHKFWAYENREAMVVESNVEEQQQHQQPQQQHQQLQTTLDDLTQSASEPTEV